MSHNYDHVYARLGERAKSMSAAEKEVCCKCFLGIDKRARERKQSMPHEWYRPIRLGKTIIGYWVGGGVIIRSFLTSDMVPKGAIL